MRAKADDFYYSVVALGAVFQAACCVHELATKGRTEDDSIESLMQGLLNQSPDSTRALLIPEQQWHEGLLAMHSIFSGQFHESGQNWLNYTNGMLRLTRTLRKDEARIDRIAQRLRSMGRQEEVDSKKIAALYQEEISTMGNQIMVKGEGGNLNNDAVAELVRCALFSGIRYGWLWQQLGGSRIQFMFRRSRINDVLRQILY